MHTQRILMTGLLLLCASLNAPALLGQAPVVNWHSTRGPNAGTVRVLAVASDGVIWAGTYGGLFRSADNGETWFKVADTLGNMDVYALACDAPGKIFVGTGNHGVFRSDDAGATWQQHNQGIDTFVITHFAFGPDGAVYAGSYKESIYRSMDGGDTWVKVHEKDANSYAWSLLALAQDTVLAGINNGILRATENDTSWSEMVSDPLLGNVLDLAVADSGKILAAGTGGGYVSRDRGRTWSKITGGLVPNGLGAFFVDGSRQILAACRGGVYRSDDNGNSWTQILYVANEVKAVVVNTAGQIFAGSFGDGVYRRDGAYANWQKKSRGLAAAEVWSLAIDDSGTVYAGARGGGVYRYVRQDTQWIDLGQGLYNKDVTSIALDSQGRLFAAPWSFYVYRSEDRGATWAQVKTGLTEQSVHVLAAAPDDALFAGTPNGIFRSTDAGDTWQNLSNGLPEKEYVYAFAFDTSGVPYAGTESGLYRFLAVASAWQNAGISGTRVQAVAVSTDGAIYAGTYGAGVYRSRDGGQLWQQINNGLQGRYIYALAARGDSVYAASAAGVSRSRDGGESWETINTGLTHLDVRALAIDREGRVYSGTYGHGVFVRTPPALTGITESPVQQPEGFTLQQNYPNPFNPATRIQFSTPVRGRVTLRIYNMAGRLVRTLVAESLRAGTHSVAWHGRDDRGRQVASGVYVVRLQVTNVASGGAQKYVAQRKVVLVR